ncbi:PAS domain-containing protein [Candidatus Fermentibacteria bacterium]|nr:PAS domain-containing protein [Candidatus Fermentibacteria bacterium]
MRARLGLLLTAVLVVLALASGLLFRQVFLRSFLEVETGMACRYAEWLASLVSGRLTALSSSAFDIAVRDETWAFMSTRNPSFVRANINGAMFSEQGVDGILLLDTAGVEVFSSSYDPSSGMQRSFPASLADVIESGLVTLLLSGDGVESGLLAAGGSNWLIASSPVLRNGGVGPRAGTLLLAKLVDEDFLDDLSFGPGMEVSLEAGEPAPGASEMAACGSGALLLWRDSPDTLVARLELTDLAGHPLALGFTMARDLFLAGRRNTETALLMLVSTGVLFVLVTVGLFDLAVVRRLDTLLKRVRRIGREGDTSVRVGLEGGDEFADLSRTMDDALDRLERTAEEAQTNWRTFDRFMKHIPGYAFITDESGRLVYASESMRREMLAGREDWAGLGYREAWPPELAVALEEADETLRRNPMPVSREIAYRGQDGETRILSSFRFPLGGGDSQESLTGGVCFDVTERIRARQELALAEKRNMALYEAVPDIIFIIGRDGVVRGFHGGVGGRLAVPPENVVGTCIDSIGMHEDDLATAMACIARSLDSGSVETFEYRIASGPSRGWFECRMAPLEADSVICTVRDATARKRMEADILRTQKEESLSFMAGGIAHDFNNILSAIGGNPRAGRRRTPGRRSLRGREEREPSRREGHHADPEAPHPCEGRRDGGCLRAGHGPRAQRDHEDRSGRILGGVAPGDRQGPPAGQRRRGADDPGREQPGRQREGRHGRGRLSHRKGLDGGRTGPILREDHVRGHRPRNSGGAFREALRPLLHYEARRHRSRLGSVPLDRKEVRRHAGAAQARGRRGGFRHEHPRRGRADVTCIGSA